MPSSSEQGTSPASSPPRRRRSDPGNWGGPWVALAALSAGAAALRAIGLRHGLPFADALDPGEREVVRHSWLVFHGGGGDPHWFRYPSLFLYVLAPAEAWHAAPSLFAARVEVVVLAVAAVAASWWLGRRVGRTAVSGAVAAAAVAVATSHVAYAHAALPDVPLTLGVASTLALAAAGRVEAAAVAAGLSAGIDYPGLLLAAPVVAAAWPSRRRIALAVVLTAATFGATTPFAFASLGRAWDDATRTRANAVPGEQAHVSAVALADRLWHMLGPALAVAVLGLGVALVRRRRADLVLVAFLVAFCVALLAFGAHSSRSVLPLAPVLAAFAARFRSLAPVTLLLLVIPLTWSVRDDRRIGQPKKAWATSYHSGGTVFSADVASASDTSTMSSPRSAAMRPNFRSCTRSAALSPKRVASTRSRGVGVPPRCTCPSTVTRVS
jgi:hypothetical protein